MSDTMPVSSEPAPRKTGGAVKAMLWTLLAGTAMGVAGYLYLYPQFEARPATVNVAGGDTALKAQVESLEHRVELLESQVESLNAAAKNETPAPAAAEVAKPTADAAKAADLARVQTDLVSLSSAMAALQTEVKANGATLAAARDNAANLIASAIAFTQLRVVADEGRPFASELAILRDAAKDDAALQAAVARLGVYGTDGVPTLPALRDELTQREPALDTALAKARATNAWQRLLAGLKSLVSVRPLHGGEGDALADVQTALGKSADAAQQAFDQLPSDVKTNLADWQKKLEARQKLDAEISGMAARFTSSKDQ